MKPDEIVMGILSVCIVLLTVVLIVAVAAFIVTTWKLLRSGDGQ